MLACLDLALVLVAGSGASRAAARTDHPTPTEKPADIQVLPPPPTQPPTTAPPAPQPAPTAPAAAPAPAPAPPPINGPLRVAFIGDSVAWTMASGLSASAPQYGMAISNDGIFGCGVVRGTPFRYFGSTYNTLPNDCDHWPQHWQDAINRDHPNVVAIMVGRWELMDRVFHGNWTHIGDPVFNQYLASEFDNAINVASSAGAKVVVFTNPYYHRGPRPDGGTWPEDDPARVDIVNALLRQAADRHPGVASVIDLGAHLSPGGQLAMQIDGVRVRTDGVHIAQSAGPWLAPWLLPQLRGVVGLT